MKASRHRFGGLLGFAEDHADALGALQQLDHQRCASDHLDQVRDIVRGMSEAGHRQADALAREQLQRAQLVPRASDGDRLVEREHAHHLELAQYRAAVEGHRGADARDHRVEALQRLSPVVDLRLVAGDVHVGAQRIDDHHFMAALPPGLHQATGRVEPGIARQHGDFHSAPVDGLDRLAGSGGEAVGCRRGRHRTGRFGNGWRLDRCCRRMAQTGLPSSRSMLVAAGRAAGDSGRSWT